MTKAPVIALLGVSGVGKSSLGCQISGILTQIIHLTAGTLLRNRLQVTNEDLRTSSRERILNNQMVLVEALKTERQGRWEAPVLLEAHAIIDNNREIIDVPADIMRALDVAGLLVLEASPDVIATRRQKDIRERPNRSISEIANQQDRSRFVAQKYAKELSIPIEFITSQNIEKAVNFIKIIISDNIKMDN